MGTTVTKKPKKPLPKPGKKLTFEQASASVMKKYAEVFAKLAK